jgi:molybdate transport system substrate-binding protein
MADPAAMGPESPWPSFEGRSGNKDFAMAVPLKILSGGAMRPLMAEVVPLFERASGARVEIEFRLTSVLRKEIAEGLAFEIAILPRPELDELVGISKIAPASAVDVARSAVGLAVRAGAARPDIGTVASFKRALQEARSIAYSDGPSGAYIAALLQRLGLDEEMKPKTKLTGRPVAELVAEGTAEVGMQQIVAILPVKGAELVGPLPSELQNVIVYAAGISTAAQKVSTARSFIEFLRSPEAVPLMLAKGLEPG